jgi:hypothetical protein
MANFTRTLFVLMLITSSIILVSCSKITQEDALKITQDFVDNQVKFYVNTDKNISAVQEASITVIDIQKNKNNWNVLLNIKSNQTGELKQSNMIVIIDGNSGKIIEVKNIKKQ